MSRPLVPTTINMHILRECNFSCAHCFAGFPEVRTRLSNDDIQRLVEIVAAAPPIFGKYQVTKVTFAGGEPTLHPALPDLVRAAKLANLTTCVVTNAHRLAVDAVLRSALASFVDWLAVSVDGPTEEINRAHGRGQGDALARVLEAVRLVRAVHPGVRVKLNTVVTALNWSTCMSDVVARLSPDRWKVLQVTRADGENDRSYPSLRISAEQFDAFVGNHRKLLPDTVQLVPEREGQVQGSYLMVDPAGHLFCNVGGQIVRGPCLLDSSLDDAVRRVGWNPDAFVSRGGSYDWGSR